MIGGPGGIGKTALDIHAGYPGAAGHFERKIFLSEKVRPTSRTETMSLCKSSAPAHPMISGRPGIWVFRVPFRKILCRQSSLKKTDPLSAKGFINAVRFN